MLGVQALEAMSEDEVLDVATACAETVRRAEVDLLRVAYQWAVLHDPARLDPVESAKPGREEAGATAVRGSRRCASSRPPSWGHGSGAPPTPRLR